MFALIGCNSSPSESVSPGSQPRELGTLTAIYPVLDSTGAWKIRLHMTKDTIVVDLALIQAFTVDSLGKSIFRSTTEPFYTEDGTCFYSRKKPDCLEFREAK